MVSEKMEIAPLFVVARALPVIEPSEVKGLVVVPKFAALIICAPKSLPIKTLSPLRSNRSELGELGKGFSFPTDALDEERK